ncbi:MAG: leucine-rich repeat domain-containing protein [Muribaculaceae bacterium]|nr:leucine-rich repeat domain-containing protein [Muribaculaceae bacterium]
MNKLRYVNLALCFLSFTLCGARDWNPVGDFCKSQVPADLSDAISVAYPMDLVPENMSAEVVADILNHGEELFRASKSCGPRMAPENRIILDLTTTEYGELSLLLDEQHGEEAYEIIVSGPMDWVDFAAVWDCAIEGNLQVLDLRNARLRNNEVPDYALYDPVQFTARHWLGIREIILPDDVVKIGKAAFPFMMLEEINIPASLRELGSTAFAYDHWLISELEIPEGVEEIKHQTFIDCLSLSSAPKLPSTLKKIGDHAFSNDPFEHITLNEGLEVIGQGAFQAVGLKEITIPRSIVRLAPMSFQMSPQLQSINLPETLETVPYGAFSLCEGLERIELPEGVRMVDGQAFLWCSKLKDVIFPETLETIETWAFSGCKINSVVFPASLKVLCDDSFSVYGLQNVYCKSVSPPECVLGELGGPFVDEWLDEEETKLYVPVGCKELYSAQWQWNKFKEIIETDEFPSSGVEVVMPGKVADGKIYDLYGREIAEPAPGQIYIQDGKKKVKINSLNF